MSTPLITTVIPTYRRPAMLRRAIQSVLNQTFREFRVCIYDNASGDETAEVLEAFRRADSRVSYVIRPRNVGAYINFTEGANRAETPFFSFLPDDDVLLPTFFETAMKGFDRHPEAQVSILSTLHMSDTGYVLGANILAWPEGLLAPPKAMRACMEYGNPGLPAMLVRHPAWLELGGWDESTAPSDDLDFELRAGARYSIVVSRQPGAIQVMHGSATTAGGGLNWIWPSIPRIIQKINGDSSIPPGERDYVVRKLRDWMYRGMITRGVLRSVMAGRSEEARKAADLLRQELARPRSSKMAHALITAADAVPGVRPAIAALVKTRVWIHDHRHYAQHERFKQYAAHLAIPQAIAGREQPSAPALAAVD